MWFQGMRTVAEQRGWQLLPSDPGFIDVYSVVTLMGEEGRTPLRLERSGGTHMYATSAFFLPKMPVVFTIRHQGVGGDIANLVGFHDIEIGDPEFDRSFRLISANPAWLIRLLTPQVREALVQLSEATTAFGMGFQVSEYGVTVTRTYMTMMTPEEVLFDVPLVTGAVRVLQAAAERPDEP
jgi:hypothetical protein